jgi:hypothetical protein
VRLEGLGKLKKFSSGLEPATFQFVAQCLNCYTTVCPIHNFLLLIFDPNFLKMYFFSQTTMVVNHANPKSRHDYSVFITKLNFVALVPERTIPTERPPLVGEVSANFCGYIVPCGQRDGPSQPYSRLS